MKKELMLELELNKVNFNQEVKKAKKSTLNQNDIKKTVEHLNWLKLIKAPIYIKNNVKVDFIYYFEYKGIVCRISALTLKIHFTGRSGKKWYNYSMDDKLKSVLLDLEEKEIKDKLSNDVVLIDLRDVSDDYNEILSTAQFDYICALLNRKKEYSHIQCNELVSIKKSLASLLIQSLKSDKKIEFIQIKKEKKYEKEKQEDFETIADILFGLEDDELEMYRAKDVDELLDLYNQKILTNYQLNQIMQNKFV